MQDALIAYLFYSSAFKDIRYDFPVGIDTVINAICMWFTRLLADLLGFCETLVRYAWDFLQFGNFESVSSSTAVKTQYSGKAIQAGTGNFAADLYNIFKDWIWIPIGICLLILIIRFFISTRVRDDLKRFSYNLIILFVVVALLPSVLFNVNKLIFNDNRNSFLSIDSTAIASKIFWNHTTDYDYMYKKYVQKIDKDAKESSAKTFNEFYNSHKKTLDLLSAVDEEGRFKVLKESSYKNQYCDKTPLDGEKYTDDFFRYYNLYNVDINESIFEINYDEMDFGRNIPIVGGIIQWHNSTLAKNIDNIFNLSDKPTMFTKRLSILSKSTVDSSVNYAKNKIINNNKGAKTVTYGGKKIKINDLDKLLYKQVINELKEKDSIKQSLVDKASDSHVLYGQKLYLRYRTDFFCVWLELLANIFLYFSAAYAILKIGWELVYHRIFLTWIAAIDLTGGDKIKRALTSILGLYISVMFIAFTLILYNNALKFMSETLQFAGLQYSVLVMMLASIALDGPNIIAKYFGVETGMRGGADILKRGLGHGVNAARTAYMFKRMHDMKKGMRGAGGRRTNLSNMKPHEKAFNWARHPITTGKGAVGDKVGGKFDNLVDNYKNNKNALKSNDAFNAKRANAGLPNQPSFNPKDYEGTATGLTGKRKFDKINNEMARDNLDKTVKDATLNKLAAPSSTDSEHFSKALSNNGNYINTGDNFKNVSDRLARDVPLGKFENAMVKDTSNKARALSKQTSYSQKEFKAHLDAANSSIGDYKGPKRIDARRNLVGKAFAETNKDSIRREALTYMKDNGCGSYEAIEHVVKNNSN